MKSHRFITFLVSAILILGLLGSVTPAAAKAQPQLIQLAAQNPQQSVSVIVQKLGTTGGAENLVADLNGKTTKDLSIINAFVAEMTADAAVSLARSGVVRWVSLDAQMESGSADNTYVTWANSIGTVVENRFIEADNMIDAIGLGPDGAYGYRTGNGKGTFTGFDVEVQPGYAITKVEAILSAYVNTPFSKDYRVKTYINGVEKGRVSLKTTIFADVMGAQNAGPVYVDITSTNAWQWADFNNNLELYIEQAGFSSGHTIYYDAIGLRVTSAPGIDSSLATLMHESR